MFTPVILAGGTGSRLWPLSRQSFPKQFIALDGQGQGTMFQRTLARLEGLQHAPAVSSGQRTAPFHRCRAIAGGADEQPTNHS